MASWICLLPQVRCRQCCGVSSPKRYALSLLGWLFAAAWTVLSVSFWSQMLACLFGSPPFFIFEIWTTWLFIVFKVGRGFLIFYWKLSHPGSSVVSGQSGVKNILIKSLKFANDSTENSVLLFLWHQCIFNPLEGSNFKSWDSPGADVWAKFHTCLICSWHTCSPS